MKRYSDRRSDSYKIIESALRYFKKEVKEKKNNVINIDKIFDQLKPDRLMVIFHQKNNQEKLKCINTLYNTNNKIKIVDNLGEWNIIGILEQSEEIIFQNTKSSQVSKINISNINKIILY